MEPITPWYADRDPETGELFPTRDAFYTWTTGWAFFDPKPKEDASTGQIYLDLVPALPSLGADAPFNYAVERVILSEDEAAPRPQYIRPLSLTPMVTLMLHIIGADNAPTIEGPFTSGMVTKSVPTRFDKYIRAINGGAPTDFAIVVREEAERWRQRREWSTREQDFMRRLYWDMVKEVELALGVSWPKAQQTVQRAFGGNPFLRATVKMRRPKPPKSGKK